MIYYVLDTSSLLRALRDGRIYELLEKGFVAITSLVLHEIKSSTSKIALDSIKDRLSIIDPTGKSIRYIQNIASKSGDIPALSDTDISVIALALELNEKEYKTVVVSEDYAIQNVCKILGLHVIGLYFGEIKEVFKRAKKCLVCGTIYDPSMNSCPSCGSGNYKLVRIKQKRKS
ncbi:MAG: hypothetical protein DRJ45_08345 [Thermoprotei archaeon]|nr:MAG: hypothetical protein DRJ45_08345 [Thermoprotei archaeon]